MALIFCLLLTLQVAVIGFRQSQYTLREFVPTVILIVEIQQGRLDLNTTLPLTTSDGTAISKILCNSL